MEQFSKLTLPPEPVAVVTGGSGGIGRIIVETLLGVGSRVAVIDPAPLPAYANLNHSANTLLPVQASVSDPAQVRDAVVQTIEHFHKIDILIHCAGILGPLGPLEDLPDEAVHDVLAVNLAGAIYISKTVLPHMKQHGHGSIIFISSISAHIGSAPAPVYAAAKAGLIALAQSLAKQAGRHRIRANCISPGSVSDGALLKNTRGFGLTSTETLGLLARLPLAQMIQARDVAQAVLFLCSDQAHLITGVNLTVDAGESFKVD